VSAPLPQKTRHLLKLYEDDLAFRYERKTGAAYLGRAQSFLDWLGARGVELSAVRTEDVHAYQSALYARRKKSGRPYSAGDQKNRVKAIKSFFRFLYRRGCLLHDPAAPLDYPRVERRLPRTILTPDEVRRILKAVDLKTPTGLRDRAIIETFYGTGIRSGELARLTPDEVDTEECVLRVVQGKGRRDRNVPLTRAAAEAIEAYLVSGRGKLVRGSRQRFPNRFATTAAPSPRARGPVPSRDPPSATTTLRGIAVRASSRASRQRGKLAAASSAGITTERDFAPAAFIVMSV